MDDLHGPAAEHIGRTDHDREADLLGDRDGLLGRAGDAVVRLPQAEALDQRLEAVAVFGQVDGVGRGAEDRHVGLFQRLRRA